MEHGSESDNAGAKAPVTPSAPAGRPSSPPPGLENTLPGFQQASSQFRRDLHPDAGNGDGSTRSRTPKNLGRIKLENSDSDDGDTKMTDRREHLGQLPHDIAKLLENSLLKDETNPDIKNGIKKASENLVRQLVQLQKSTARVTKMTDEAEQLARGSIPSSLPKFKTPHPSPQLLKVFAPEAVKVEFDIPEGSSATRAKEIIHFNYVRWTQQVDLFVVKQHVQILQQETKLSTFRERCNATCDKLTNAAKVLNVIIEEEDTIPVYDMQQRATLIYRKALEKVATAKIKDDAKSDALAVEKQKVVEKVSSMPPTDWLKEAIRLEARKISGKGRGSAGKFSVDYAGIYAGPETPDIATFVEQQPKNYSSPGGAQGQNTQPKPKAAARPSNKSGKGDDKGSGKSSGKSKSKGKGKSKPNAAGKNGQKGKGRGSKGKGKGKGKAR